MTILTPRLRIEPLTPSILCAALADRPALEKLLCAEVPADWPAPDLAEFLPVLGGMIARSPELSDWIGVIVSRSDRAVVGDAGFKGLPDADGSVELGYSILPPYRGRGYAQEAASALCNAAFERGVRTIRAECDGDNGPSIAVLRKLGLSETGRAGGVLSWERRAR